MGIQKKGKGKEREEVSAPANSDKKKKSRSWCGFTKQERDVLIMVLLGLVLSVGMTLYGTHYYDDLYDGEQGLSVTERVKLMMDRAKWERQQEANKAAGMPSSWQMPQQHDQNSAPTEVNNPEQVQVMERERNINSYTSQFWELYEPHRAEVTDLILRVGAKDENPDGSRTLLLVGGGNLNDVNLVRLLQRGGYDQIFAADFDLEALQNGVDRQANLHFSSDPDARARFVSKISLHQVDFAGIHQLLDIWLEEGLTETGRSSSFDITASDVDTLLQHIEAWQFSTQLLNHLHRASTVASLCTLRALVDQVAIHWPSHVKGSAQVMAALRHQHLYQLSELTGDGGTAVLISELTSSLSFPALDSTSFTSSLDLDLDLLEHLFKSKQYFPGVHALTVREFFSFDPRITELTHAFRLGNMWKWAPSPDVTYLVFSAVWKRTRTDSDSQIASGTSAGAAPGRTAYSSQGLSHNNKAGKAGRDARSSEGAFSNAM